MKSGNTLIINAFWVDNIHFPSEEEPSSKVGQIFHEGYSGSATHLGWMDMIQLKKMIESNSISHIILQNLDVLGKAAMVDGFVKVCTAYVYKKYHIIRSFCKDIAPEDLQPLYECVEVGGWDFSKDDDEIPLRAKFFMRYLLMTTGVKSISYSSNRVKVTAFWDDLRNVHFSEQKIS